ncbi:MAG: hypothetical protein U0166_01960 [Acidobacteriota bacterium]
MLLPLDRSRMAERNRLDEAQEWADSVRMTPFELSSPIEEESRIWVAPLRLLVRR